MSQFDLEDLPTNLSDNEHFHSIVERVISRRGFLKLGAGASAAAFLGGMLSACGGSSSGSNPASASSLLGFKPVEKYTGDQVVVPEGYSVSVLAPWGTPLFGSTAAYRDDGSNSAADQAEQVGDNHDGMHYFPINGSEEGLLVINHEYHERTMYADREPKTLDDCRKSQHAHGVSVLHIKKNAQDRWEVVVDSRYNRRIHGNTETKLTGPVAGDDLVVTSADPLGKTVLGTLNNCGNGHTLWGTYLTCEENFNQYFGTTSPEAADGNDPRDALLRRYGINRAASGGTYRWERFDDRFDYMKEPNEPNRFGWIVEIDPFDPDSPPLKRTALGRFKHENCAMTLSRDNRVVVYSGDDQAGEYIYKFVSDGYYDPNNPIGNRELLKEGKLYVARFEDRAPRGEGMLGTGRWILLDKNENEHLRQNDHDFPDQAAVLVKTRLAADAVGATPMDRPEWIAVHPKTGEVYCTLTNNKGRTESEVDGVNPRASNIYGHIIRWREAGDDAAALEFEWDLFVLAGNLNVYPPNHPRAGSANVTRDNAFNSPDGLAFDADGRLWIQTDGDDSDAGDFAGQGNNQMLAADPATGEIRRFLYGPKGCEVTGIAWTPDQRTMFVNIQHPGGSWPKSQWPEITGGGARPRSATVVITKDDGGVIGT